MNWIRKFCQKNQIFIDMEDYSTKCLEEYYLLSESFKEKNYELQNFQINIPHIAELLKTINFPNTENVIQSILSDDHEKMMSAYSSIYEWSKSQKALNYDNVYEINTQIRNHINKHYPYELSEEDAQKLAKQSIQVTENNMNVIKNKIEIAIKNIGYWSIPLIIKPIPSSQHLGKLDHTRPCTAASIKLGESKLTPDFSCFLDENNQISIDDVLEGGDTDFFESPSIQRDYFNLIKELNNPGSSKTGKMMTLYTARPIKDRNIYMNKLQIPTNIFLTNRFNDAEALISDLPGTDKRRDVWKVKIDSRFLIETLNNGITKHYQAIGESWIPVTSLELISTGD